MAVSKFVLEIDLGNESMKLPQHIQEALVAVSKQLPHVIMSKGASVKIKDVNGNTVGKWEYR